MEPQAWGACAMCVSALERSWCCELAAGCLQEPDLEDYNVSWKRSHLPGFMESLAKGPCSLQEAAAEHIITPAELDAIIASCLPPGTLCLS